MKKLFCILCALFCLFSLSAMAEESLVDEFFRCQVGQISFALPGYPQIFHEEDLPARELEDTYCAWLNKLQLAGSGAEGGEYQVHIADLTPAIEWMREDRPGEEEPQYQLNALMNMITFYLAIHEGNVTEDVQPLLAKAGDQTFVELTFGYTYPDAPDVEYRGRAFMDGSIAVVMMVEADSANMAALADMRPLSAEKADAFRQTTPEAVIVGQLQITFPETPLATTDDGHWLYEAFTADFGYVSIEHMQADLSYMLTDGMSEDELLAALAESTAKSYQKQGVISEYELRQLAGGVYAFDARQTDDLYPEGYGPLGVRIIAVFTLDGVYTVTAVETEMGRAFCESLTVVSAE